MIIITDFPNATPPHWEVVDSTGKLGKNDPTYNSSDPTGYDRVRVLQQNVELYSALSGCNNKSWQTVGSVFILT